MYRTIQWVLVALAATPMAAWCQTPIISNLVDAASYAQTLGAAGSLATIFGTNLATATATATATPLPRQLGGTRVTWNGVACPILYVSPAQINFQIPSPNDTLPGVLVIPGIVVTTAAGNSIPYRPGFSTSLGAGLSAGIFSMDGSGCGQGAVLNVAADGGVSRNSATNSVSPGDWISIFGTGIGPFYVVVYPEDGIAAPAAPLVTLSPPGFALFDFQELLNAPAIAFTGLAPGFVGVGQSNIRVPATVREGCAVPLQIAYTDSSNATTQPITIAIRNGGGSCVDPPAQSYGQITFQKTVTETLTGIQKQPYTRAESDTLTVALLAGPGLKASPTPVYKESSVLPATKTLSTPVACPIPGYRGLAAGSVTVQSAGLSPAPVQAAEFQQGQLGGLTAYQTTIPSSVPPGKYTVSASGGADVGAFQATAQIGADIDIQSPLTGSKLFGTCKPVTIDWTGGDPNSWVTVRLIQKPQATYPFQFVLFSWQARTSDGTLTMPAISFSDPAGTICLPPQPNLISIEVDPDPSEIAEFSAPGLSLGGQVTWKYVHNFQVQ